MWIIGIRPDAQQSNHWHRWPLRSRRERPRRCREADELAPPHRYSLGARITRPERDFADLLENRLERQRMKLIDAKPEPKVEKVDRRV